MKRVDPCAEFHEWAKRELAEAKVVHKRVADQLSNGTHNLNNSNVETILEQVASHMKQVDPCAEFHEWAKRELAEAKLLHKRVADQLSNGTESGTESPPSANPV